MPKPNMKALRSNAFMFGLGLCKSSTLKKPLKTLLCKVFNGFFGSNAKRCSTNQNKEMATPFLCFG